MAGRRWAEGKAKGAAGAPAPPRPSERTGAGQAPDGGGKRKAKSKPSPEAMARARQRLAPPPAPWHPLPLSELAIVFGGLAMLAAVLLSSDRGLIAGFVLIILGTGEFSWREHRHGHRSHGALLSGILALPIAIVLWKIVGLDERIALGVGAVLFLFLWSVLNASFKTARERRLAGDGG